VNDGGIGGWRKKRLSIEPLFLNHHEIQRCRQLAPYSFFGVFGKVRR
jgi:hypothetical protein